MIRALGDAVPGGAALAQARADAHRAFDPLWRTGMLTREEALRWIGSVLDVARGVTVDLDRLGLEDCRRVVRASLVLGLGGGA